MFMPRLKFLLIPIGSAGDVHPFIWLGKLLRARGHEVVVFAQEMVRAMPERAGLPTVAWGDAGEQEGLVRNPDIWHPRKGFELIARYASQWAGESLAVIRPQVEAGRTVMVGGVLALGARVLAERWGVPLVTVQLQPMVFMSVAEPPVMVARGEWLARSPRWVRLACRGIADWQVNRMMGPAIERVRRSAGLPARVGPVREYWDSPDGVLCLFPEFFARKAADWPGQAVVTRFPLYDETGDRPADAALEAYFAAGEAPVIITPGSANAHAERFFREAAAGCARVGRRALVITRYPGQAGALPGGSACFGYVPFSQAFGRGAAVIHHGGIGTTAQCLAAGVPQLIMPLAHDQPDNAARVKRMGVGDYLYPRGFKPERIAERLEYLLTAPGVKEACGAFRQKMQGQMSEDQVGGLIEGLSDRALRRSDGP